MTLPAFRKMRDELVLNSGGVHGRVETHVAVVGKHCRVNFLHDNLWPRAGTRAPVRGRNMSQATCSQSRNSHSSLFLCCSSSASRLTSPQPRPVAWLCRAAGRVTASAGMSGCVGPCSDCSGCSGCSGSCHSSVDSFTGGEQPRIAHPCPRTPAPQPPLCCSGCGSADIHPPTQHIQLLKTKSSCQRGFLDGPLLAPALSLSLSLSLYHTAS